MVANFEKYIPQTQNDLETQLVSYDIIGVKEQQEQINIETGNNLKEAHRDTMISLISGYILNKAIDISKIEISGSEISFNGINFINTNLSDLSIEEIKTGIKMDFITRHFPKNNSGRQIVEQVALNFKSDFQGESIVGKKDHFNNTIEDFKSYLISKDPENKEIYKIMSIDELKSMWAGVQIELATKLKVIGIEETTSGMEKLLGGLNIDGLNGKTLSENWKEANGLLKTGATIAGIYGLYKVITSMWNSKNNPLKDHFWKAIGAGLVGELVGQVYAGKSYTAKGIGAALDFIKGDSNINELKKQYNQLNTNETNKIVDYPGLALLLLGNKKGNEIKGNFDFINKNTKDPFIQGIIIEEEKRGNSIDDLKKKLKKGRDTLITNTTEGFSSEDKLSLDELMQVEGETLLEKRTVIINRVKTLKEDIKNNNHGLSEQEVLNHAKGQIKDKLINGGKLIIDLSMGKIVESNL